MNEALQEFRHALAAGCYAIAELKLASYIRSLDKELSTCANDDSRRELIANALATILHFRTYVLMGRAQLQSELDRLPHPLPYSPARTTSTWTIEG